jgi:hypothetical protein
MRTANGCLASSGGGVMPHAESDSTEVALPCPEEPSVGSGSLS